MEPTNAPETATAPAPDQAGAQIEQLPDGQSAELSGPVDAPATGEPRHAVEVPQNADGTWGPAELSNDEAASTPADVASKDVTVDESVAANVAPAPEVVAPMTVDEQAKAAVLTREQPPGAVSEVVTGTPERPESTRIVPPGEVPASAGRGLVSAADDAAAASTDLENVTAGLVSQVAPTQVEGEQGLHGNADY